VFSFDGLKTSWQRSAKWQSSTTLNCFLINFFLEKIKNKNNKLKKKKIYKIFEKFQLAAHGHHTSFQISDSLRTGSQAELRACIDD
jgi:diacylglycerol kinase